VKAASEKLTVGEGGQRTAGVRACARRVCTVLASIDHVLVWVTLGCKMDRADRLRPQRVSLRRRGGDGWSHVVKRRVTLMQIIVVLIVIFLAGWVSEAAADCTNNRVTGIAIETLLSNSLVCGSPAVGYTGSSSDRWQEEHLNSGALYDYKLGSDAVDPRVQMGTWVRSGNSVVYTYDRYSPASIITYDGIYQVGTTGNTYSFCQGGSEIVRATVTQQISCTSGSCGTGCGGVFP
jgi:hypothetical protein